MRVSRVSFMLIGLIAVIGATWIYTQQRKPASHVLLSPEDYIEIQQLYGLYTRDVDPGSRRDASWMFTADGVFQVGNRKYSGHQELEDQYLLVRERNATGVRHVTTTYVIVGTPEGALGSAYMLTIERKEEGEPVEVTGFGKYEDRFVKTRDGWRIKERVWTSEPFEGSTDSVLPSPIPGDR